MFYKIYGKKKKTPVPESLLNKVTLSLIIRQLCWKKRLRYRCCLVILYFFTVHEQATTSVLQKNILPIKQEWALWKKKKKTASKNNNTGRKKLNHYLHQFFISFYYSKISFFLLSLLPMTHWKRKFLETMQSHQEFVSYKNLFLIFSNLEDLC